MLWAEWQAWGMNPVGYHVVNVLLHAAAAVLLWRVLRRLRIPGAWLGAALFAVHPVATLSAAWITEGKNTLSLALYLLALWAFLDYDERGGKGRYFLSLAGLSFWRCWRRDPSSSCRSCCCCAPGGGATESPGYRAQPAVLRAGAGDGLGDDLVPVAQRHPAEARPASGRRPARYVAASGWIAGSTSSRLLPAGLSGDLSALGGWTVESAGVAAAAAADRRAGWLWMRPKNLGPRAVVRCWRTSSSGCCRSWGSENVVHAAVAGLGPFPVRGDDRHHGARRRHPGAGRGRARLDGAPGQCRGDRLRGGPGVRRPGTGPTLRRRGAFLAG